MSLPLCEGGLLLISSWSRSMENIHSYPLSMNPKILSLNYWCFKIRVRERRGMTTIKSLFGSQNPKDSIHTPCPLTDPFLITFPSAAAASGREVVWPMFGKQAKLTEEKEWKQPLCRRELDGWVQHQSLAFLLLTNCLASDAPHSSALEFPNVGVGMCFLSTDGPSLGHLP